MIESYVDFYQVKGSYNFSGQIKCGGAKNLSTKVIMCTLLSDNISILDNIPDIIDIRSTQNLLDQIGAEYEHNNNRMIINPSTINNFSVKKEENILYGRIPILLLAAMIHRSKEVSVPKLDGCQFGPRKIDFFLLVLDKFGIKIEEYKNNYIAKRSTNLRGQKIELPFPSVGATEFTLLLAVLADGISSIKNIAVEPEILCLITLLQQMGAKIHWINKNEILIEGVSSLSGANHQIMGDRIETASWAVLAACSDGEIEVKNTANIEYLSTFLGVFQRMGGGFTSTDKSIKFFRKEKLKNITLETGTYPAFSTDYQPMISLMMSQADGISAIHETLFEDRLSHLQNLEKFGVNSSLMKDCIGEPCKFQHQNHYHSAFISGNSKLKAPNEIIYAENLRSGITYLLAACISDGISKIGNLNLISRGYENILQKLKSLNVDINLFNKRGKYAKE